MAKPASPAKPAITKPKKPEHVEVNTDHVRPGPVGDYEGKSEAEVIAEAAKDHVPGGGEEPAAEDEDA